MQRYTSTTPDFTKVFNGSFTENVALLNPSRFPVNTGTTSTPPTVTAPNAIDQNPASPWVMPGPLCDLYLDFPYTITVQKLYFQTATLVGVPGILSSTIEGQMNDGTWGNIGSLSPQPIGPGLPMPLSPIDVVPGDYKAIKFSVNCNVPAGIFDIKYS
ncbi:hypothetical protein [Paenibacillus sp. FSL K6-0108]|uniref:hypothetical protein n=1 Tax=Paenibacillus sp. FSL K6-0108 TaxID=2921417 RepID=UPI00324E2953